MAGLRVDDETIRRHVHRAAAPAAARREAEPPAAAFAAAAGEAEFLADGVMAPSRDGWRELKLAVYLRRPAGEPAAPEEWAARELPAATATAAYAALADCEAFAARWGPRAEELGIDPAGPLTVLGEGTSGSVGARGGAVRPRRRSWISSTPRSTSPRRRPPFTARGPRRRPSGPTEAAELADGWPGLLADHIGATPTGGRTAAGQAGLDGLIAYFAKHTDRLGYFGRLRSGRSIGSGAVEGLARRMGRRLKVPGRGWCAGNLDGMAAVARVDTPEWDSLWTKPAA